jgi:aldose 1-epimerase
MAREIITITDPATGATARFLPSVGCNCFRFQVLTSSGPLDVLWSEPGFEGGDKRASGSGIPLLFPFPGRIQGTTLRWDGRDWPLEPGDGLGNAIHGFVHQRAWRVVELDTGCLVAEFQASRDDPQLLDRWPADFRITASYEVRAARLSATYRMENPDQRPLPCGFGTHPYFRLPLGGSSAQACRVRLPVQCRWELAAMIPTGRKLPLDDATRFQQGQRFGQMKYDDVFADLVQSDGRCEATIDDPESARCTSLTFDSTFRECVVYTPPHREAICIEPYTCVPDPFRLETLGIATGLRVLGEYESCEVKVEIELR